ncbi:hypothetical protein JCM16303_006650 [Sporobolomyces ruberrimus]
MAISTFIHERARRRHETKLIQQDQTWMSDEEFLEVLVALLCFFFPPLAVFLERGAGGDLLLNILLTILGIVPGIIHALFVCIKAESHFQRFKLDPNLESTRLDRQSLRDSPSTRGPTFDDFWRPASEDERTEENPKRLKGDRDLKSTMLELGRSSRSNEKRGNRGDGRRADQRQVSV